MNRWSDDSLLILPRLYMWDILVEDLREWLAMIHTVHGTMADLARHQSLHSSRVSLYLQREVLVG